MYKKIVIPVDLAHREALTKALDTGADLAGHYDVPVVYVGVTSSAPGSLGHNPAEYEKLLEDFAAGEASRRGIDAGSRALVSHDPAVDLDKALLKAIDDLGADLVVMASHVPGVADHLFSSNAGHVASHAAVSVLVVR